MSIRALLRDHPLQCDCAFAAQVQAAHARPRERAETNACVHTLISFLFASTFTAAESCLQWLFPDDVDLQLRGEGVDSKWVLHRIVNGKDKYLTNSAFHKLLHNVLHAGEVSDHLLCSITTPQLS